MRQAIAEGFIHHVLSGHTTYGVYYKLANSHPRNDPQMESRKGRAVMARFAPLHPDALDAKAEVIMCTSGKKTAGKIDGHAKAMVVTRSRLHAVRTQAALEADEPIKPGTVGAASGH
jgi:type I restriction enzyme R subunit